MYVNLSECYLSSNDNLNLHQKSKFPVRDGMVVGFIRWGVLDTTLFDQVCQWAAAGRWFSPVLWFPPPIKLTATI
jgi:hypothetical protein